MTPEQIAGISSGRRAHILDAYRAAVQAKLDYWDACGELERLLTKSSEWTDDANNEIVNMIENGAASGHLPAEGDLDDLLQASEACDE